MSFLLLGVSKAIASGNLPTGSNLVFAASFNNNYNEYFGRTATTSNLIDLNSSSNPNANWTAVLRARYTGSVSYISYPTNNGAGSDCSINGYSGDLTIEFLYNQTPGLCYTGELSVASVSGLAPIRINNTINTGVRNIRHNWGSTGNQLICNTSTGWHHYALTKSGQNVKVYLDGTLANSVTNAPSTLSSNGVGNFYPACTVNSNGTFLIGNMAIYKSVVYTGSFTPNYDPWAI
jgi:hypothetical protein